MAESVVASLRSKLVLDPSKLMPGKAPPGTISASSSLLSIASATPEVDLSNPAELSRLLKAAHELQDQVAALTQAQNELQATNKALRSEIETYSRHTLPNAVMTKYERDQSVSGIEELGGLHKVPHRRTGSGSWRRVEEEKLDANQIVEAQRLQEQGTDKLFRAGWMYKEGGLVHNWKRRLFILYANSICYYVNPEDSTPKGVIKLDTCTISPVKSRDGVDKPCMELVFSKTGRRWRFFCEKVSDNRRWFSAINNRIVTLSYIHRCEQVKQRPDYRVLQFLNTVPANADAAAKIVHDNKSPKSSIIGPIEQWPDSHPLTLSGQPVSLDTVSVVARIIAEPSTCPGGGVSHLEISNAGLGFFELETIFKAMSASEYNIVVQKERSNSMDRRVDASEDLAPDYTPSEHHAIEALNLSGNSFIDPRDENNLAAAHALAKVLQVNTTLTELVLDHCGINDKVLEVIGEALPAALCPIRKLSLKGNTFTDRGLSSLLSQLGKGILPLTQRAKEGNGNNLASPLRVLPLVDLSLDNNQIADAGAAAVAKLVMTPKIALTRLSLSHNKIGAEGAVALAEAVSANATLTSLDLSDNAVKKEHTKAAAALAHMAQANESLIDARFLDFALTPPTLNSMRLVAKFKVGQQ